MISPSKPPSNPPSQPHTYIYDFTRAPDHKFPVPVEDCWDAFEFLSTNCGKYGGDPARIALAGDSAGGNLACVMALMARDKGVSVCFQLLIYPATCAYGATNRYVSLSLSLFLYLSLSLSFSLPSLCLRYLVLN